MSERLAIKTASVSLPSKKVLLRRAAAVTSGLGVYHSGVERLWWTGPASCTGSDVSGLSTEDLLAQLTAALYGDRYSFAEVATFQAPGISKQMLDYYLGAGGGGGLLGQVLASLRTAAGATGAQADFLTQVLFGGLLGSLGTSITPCSSTARRQKVSTPSEPR